MLPFGTAEVNYNREDAVRLLPGTAVIQSVTWAADGQGGSVQAFAASGTVSARLGPLGGQELEYAERLGASNPYSITVPAATSVPVTGRIVYNGGTYEITNVPDRTPWEIVRRVMVTQLS